MEITVEESLPVDFVNAAIINFLDIYRNDKVNSILITRESETQATMNVTLEEDGRISKRVTFVITGDIESFRNPNKGKIKATISHEIKFKK